jgi:SAM-dependent methyltransferase
MAERKTHWDAVYTDKPSNQVSWYQTEATVSLQLIHNCALDMDAPIIDVGGGAAPLADRLLDQGYRHIAVLDISSQALAISKRRLGARAQAIQWFCADITEFTPPYDFALWHDRAVFHFLTAAEDRQRYVEVLKKSLQPGGHLIIGAFAIGGPTQCSGLDIEQYDAAKLLHELGDSFALLEETRETHLTPAGKQQAFAWFRLRRK